MSTTYKGVKINLTFRGGNTASRINGKLITSDPFVQDAIEAMPSFGRKVFCSHAYNPSRQAEPTAATSKKPRLVSDKGIADRVSKAKTAKRQDTTAEGAIIVDDVKNINDAISYFSEMGVTLESKEQLDGLIAKHNVVFPNMK